MVKDTGTALSRSRLAPGQPLALSGRHVMENLIGFIGAMGLQLILVAFFIATVLSFKLLIRRISPVFHRYTDQIKEILQRERHADPGTHHPG